jgi:hypothetical protein
MGSTDIDTLKFDYKVKLILCAQGPALLAADSKKAPPNNQSAGWLLCVYTHAQGG